MLYFDLNYLIFHSQIPVKSKNPVLGFSKRTKGVNKPIYNPQIEMFARFKMKSSFHKTKRII